MAPRNSKKREPEHPSQSSFGQLLAQFVGPNGDGFDSYTDEKSMSISPALLTQVSKSKKEKESRPKPGGSYDAIDIFDDDDDDIESLLPEDDEYDPKFDEMIEGIFEDDENVGMRNSLISLGRKYAIKGMEEGAEASEVNRAFVRQETALEDLMSEINQNSAALGRDIEMLRMSRTKSYKSLADLVSAQATMTNAKLSIIKEMSSIAKTKFDITTKIKKESANADADSGMSATHAVQRILSLGRASLVPDDDDGDYAPSTGSHVAAADFDDGRPETAIHMAMDIPPAETDGDKFIEHEGEGIEYVVDINSEDDSKQIYAIDKAGNVVPDYPMPSNPDQLSFQINELAGEATDQLQRRYRVRRDGEDIIEHEYDSDSSQW